VTESVGAPPADEESLVSAAVAAGALGGIGDGAGVRAAAGTGQSVAGLGGAPGSPSIRGVPGAHATAANATVASVNRWTRRKNREKFMNRRAGVLGGEQLAGEFSLIAEGRP
jgi:hypothetical protein